jgi:hypothetical protein
MSTGLIIVIVVVVLLIIALLVMLPRMRAQAREREARRELGGRRDRVATENREQAGERARQAEQAEQKASIATATAERERAEARRLEADADRHESGLADDELIEDHERDRLGPVAGTPIDTDGDGHADRVDDDRIGHDDRVAPDDQVAGRSAGDAGNGDAGLDEREIANEQGREDEKRGDNPAVHRSDV